MRLYDILYNELSLKTIGFVRDRILGIGLSTIVPILRDPENGPLQRDSYDKLSRTSPF